MEQDVASDGERELKENRSLSLLVKVQKKSRHKKYSHGTVGSMSTVVQDLHGGRSRSSRRRHTTQRHRQQRWLRERPEEKQIVAVVCEVRETILFAKKYCHDTVGFVSICKTHTLTVSSAPRWSTVVAKDQVQTRQISCSRLTCSYANQRQTALADWTAETECLYKSTERAQCHCEQQYACLLP